MDRIGGISMVDRGEEVTTKEEMGRGDGMGKSDLFGERVCLEYQSVACSVESRWEVHPGVMTFKGRVTREDG